MSSTRAPRRIEIPDARASLEAARARAEEMAAAVPALAELQKKFHVCLEPAIAKMEDLQRSVRVPNLRALRYRDAQIAREIAAIERIEATRGRRHRGCTRPRAHRPRALSRSSSRSGDSGDDDASGEPDPAERRLCVGCGVDISDRRKDATNCGAAKCRKRVQRKRTDPDRYPGQDADEYLNLPGWERDALQRRAAEGCRCNGGRVARDGFYRDDSYLVDEDGLCAKCGHSRHVGIAPFYLALWARRDALPSLVRAASPEAEHDRPLDEPHEPERHHSGRSLDDDQGETSAPDSLPELYTFTEHRRRHVDRPPDRQLVEFLALPAWQQRQAWDVLAAETSRRCDELMAVAA